MKNISASLPKKSSPLLRLNALCPYYTMFPLEFPYRSIRNFGGNPTILDPFCGRGTTNYAARLLGKVSIGVDSNPVAHAIAASKFSTADPFEILDLCNAILREMPEPKHIPSGPFWRGCFHVETLREICKLREYLQKNCRSKSAVALRGLLLGILHGPRNKGEPSYLSNQMPRTYATKPDSAVRYWKKNGLKPRRIKVSTLVARRAWFSFAQIPPKIEGYALLSDSRDLDNIFEPEQFDLVVTSPPYYGMRTYRSDQWLRNWFLGGPDNVDYRNSHQIADYSLDNFSEELSKVWKSVAKVSRSGARLIVRFGAIPSVQSDPSSVLRRSLAKANSGWRVTTIRCAGSARQGRRQAEQFGVNSNSPFNEIDLYARLEA